MYLIASAPTLFNTRCSPRFFRFVLVLCLSAWLAGCATTAADGPAVQDSTAEAAHDSGDPLEGLNRAIYAFNDVWDRYLAKPVAQGYRWVLPDFLRQGVSNFFSNLVDPVIMANGFLQGKFSQGASDFGRIVVNTTLGIGGLFDVATQMGLEKHEEDFGQTLAVWGVGEGPYLVLPILGPSNVRDGLSLVPDWYLYPPTYIEDRGTANALIVVQLINRRAQLLEASDILDQAAGEDSYVFVREAYRQRRLNLIYDGNPPIEAPDPSLFEDELPPPAQKK